MRPAFRYYLAQARIAGLHQKAECGPTARVLDDPAHSYTQRLRDSVPPGWAGTTAPGAGRLQGRHGRPMRMVHP